MHAYEFGVKILRSVSGFEALIKEPRTPTMELPVSYNLTSPLKLEN